MSMKSKDVDYIQKNLQAQLNNGRNAINENAESFDDLGPVLIVTPGGCLIRGGHVWKAPTSKGGYNYLITMRIFNGWMYYAHGDRIKKIQAERFCQCVDEGEFDHVKYTEMDQERLSMAMIGFDAIANRRTYEQSMEVSEQEMEVALKRGTIDA